MPSETEDKSIHSSSFKTFFWGIFFLSNVFVCVHPAATLSHTSTATGETYKFLKHSHLKILSKQHFQKPCFDTQAAIHMHMDVNRAIRMQPYPSGAMSSRGPNLRMTHCHHHHLI